MEEDKYANAMKIIMYAGNAKSEAMLAMDGAAEGDFAGAASHLELARNEMRAAHKVQFDLVRAEANGEGVEVHVVLVHAQDHLTMAIMSIDFAERVIDLYKKLSEKE